MVKKRRKKKKQVKKKEIDIDENVEEEIDMGIMDKMLGKKELPAIPVPAPETGIITKVTVDDKTNPEREKRTEPQTQPETKTDAKDTPTVPLLAKYDEAQIMQIQALQDMMAEERKTNQLLVKLYEFFVDQSKQ